MCAMHFGWDKEQVDKQPVKYLSRLLNTFIKDTKRGGGANITAMNKIR